NNYLKLSALATFSLLRAGRSFAHRRLGGRDRLALRHSVHIFQSRFADINPALEVRAIFNADALADHVSGQRTFIADVHAITGGQIALHFAQDHHFFGVDVRLHLSVAAYGYTMAAKVDGAFHAAIDVQRFRPSHFAFDHQRFADGGLFLGVEYCV